MEVPRQNQAERFSLPSPSGTTSARNPPPEPVAGDGQPSTGPGGAADEPERSLTLLRAALDSTAEGILVVNRGGKIVHYNRKFAEMWGLAPEVLALGEDATAIEFAQAHLRDPEGFAERIRELYTDPGAESYDVIELTDGRIFERYSQPQEIGGEIVGRVWSYRDATRRRQAERVLRRRERQLRETQKLAHLGSWRWNAASGEVVLSRELARICGFEKGAGAIPLRRFFEHIPPDDRPQLRRAIRTAVEEGTPFELVHRVVRPDGSVCILHSRGRRVGAGRGKQARLLGTGQEITDLKQAEQQAQQMADRMRAVASAAAGVIGAETEVELRSVLEDACRTVLPFDAFFIQAYDAEEHIFRGVGGMDAGVYSPSRVIPATGTPGERVVRQRRTLLTHRSTDPAAQGAWLTGTGRRSESAIRTPILSGKEVLGLIAVQSYTPDLYTEQDAQVLEALASLAATALTNIRLLSERRAAEAALRASERRFRTIFEQFPFSVQIFAPTGESLEVNQAWRDLFRTTPEEIAGYNVLEDPQLEEMLPYIRQAFAGETLSVPPTRYDTQRTLRELTGSEHAEASGPTWLQAFWCPVKDVDGSVRELFHIHQDVTAQKEAEEVLRRSHEELERLVAARTAQLAATNRSLQEEIAERKQAERALQRSEEQFRFLIENASDVVTILGPDGVNLYQSPSSQRVFGYPPEEMVGTSAFDRIHPEDAALCREVMRWVMEHPGAVRSAEFRYRHKDGSWLVIEALARTLLPHSPAGGIVVNSRDVTERKQYEVNLRQAKTEAEEAREAAERANRAKSEFLSRMSHELRTPMNSILGFGQLLAKHDLTEDQRRSTDHILRAGKHLLRLIDEVLDIARIEANRQQLSLEPVSVRSVVQEAVSLIRPLAAQHGCELADLPADGCDSYVRADRQRFTQVLLNLLSNAIKYNRPGGSVAISCDTVREGAGPTEGHLRIHVRDTGPGIPAERLSELFVPFSRLGAEQTEIEGTGLGLALSKRLVEAMGGRLTVASVVDEGSTFSVELPLTENPVERWAAARTGAAESPAAERESRSATILYIEDNLANFSLIESILAARPEIALISALQGRLGLDLAGEHAPDLILLDLHLPDMPGEEVLRRLRSDTRTRDVPIIIISADATPSRIQRLRAAGAHDYITKPLDVDGFLEAVDRVLLEEGE